MKKSKKQTISVYDVPNEDLIQVVSDRINSGEFDDSDIEYIIDIIGDWKYQVVKGSVVEYLQDMPNYKLKDLLCDVAGVSHYTSKDDLLKLIGERI